MIAAQRAWIVILTAYQHLVEIAPAVREVPATVAPLPRARVDRDGFVIRDGRYTAVADLFSGDTAS